MFVQSNSSKIRNDEDVAQVFRDILKAECEVDRDKEHFWVLGLDCKLGIKYIELVSLGVLDSAVVHPREVFRTAISRAVKTIIVAHNHPTGDATPSDHDDIITRRLVSAGDIIGIKVQDHIVVAGTCHYSYLEHRKL